MNNQHKLYDYEVVPPGDAWNQISRELDEIATYKKVSEKLQNIDAAAPATVWNNINNELNDQESFDIISKKLLNAEVMPPPMAWMNIETAITKASPAAKVVPIGKPKNQFIKYAAAAALVGILALAGYYVAERSSKDVEIISANLHQEARNNNTIASNQVTGKTVNIKNTKDSVSTKHQNPQIIMAASAPAVVTTSLGNAYTTTVEKNREVDGRYIVLMTQDGNVVRMNKKVSGLADCIAGEDNSPDCNAQISQWQQEIASSPVITTPDNFLGLLALANRESGL